MRAVVCSRLDGPSALTIGDMPVPALGPGQVRLAVRAAGVNFADTLIVQGRYQVKPALPFVPGAEAAGEIVEVAPDVQGLRPGARVMAATGTGAFAEYAVCNANAVFPLPDSLDFVTAAGVPVAYGTAHGGLDWRAGLKPGETAMILGAAGGVGLAAVEVAKVMGATVIAAARGSGKLAIAREHGADHVIDYAAGDLREAVKALTGGRGVDVVFDPVGGDAFDSALRTLGWEGRLVVVGFAAGRIPQIPANLLLVKNIAVTGLFWGEYRKHNPQRVHESFATLMRWLEEGRLKPHVSHVLPLGEAGAAMEMLVQRKATGKIVLTV